MKATSKRRVAGDEDNVFAYVTTHVNPFMSLTAVDDVEIKMDCVSERNRKKEHYKPFLCEEETVTMKQHANETSYVPVQTKLASSNPFIDANRENYDFPRLWSEHV